MSEKEFSELILLKKGEEEDSFIFKSNILDAKKF